MNINNDVEVVITSFNQKSMIYEAVHSLCCQTIKPNRIIIVDDGSTDEISINVLNELKAKRQGAGKTPAPFLSCRFVKCNLLS